MRSISKNDHSQVEALKTRSTQNLPSAKGVRLSLLVLAVLSMTLTFSCKKRLDSTDPKGRLSEYISRSFSVEDVGDKALLMSYLTGDVRSRLESWSEDQFRSAFIESRRQFLHLLFKEIKVISSTEIQITYELSYLEQSKSSSGEVHDTKVTNKKLCQMKLEKGNWMVADVKNIKELIEYKNEMSLP